MMTNEEFYGRIAETIRMHKRQIITVFGNEKAPPFGFTIGNALANPVLPEILVLGLTGGNAVGTLNLLSERMLNLGRPFEHGELVDLGGGVPMQVWATDDRARTYTIQATEFYGALVQYALIQAVVPDTAGRFPGDPACDPRYARFPVLKRTLN